MSGASATPAIQRPATMATNSPAGTPHSSSAGSCCNAPSIAASDVPDLQQVGLPAAPVITLFVSRMRP